MKKLYLITMSLLGVLCGFSFDIYIMHTIENKSQLDFVIYIVSLLVMLDVIFRESLRITLLPDIVENLHSIKQQECSVVAVIFASLILIITSIFIHNTVCGIILSVIAYLISSLYCSFVQCILVAEKKLINSNFKNIVFYVIPAIFCVVFDIKNTYVLITGFYFGNLVYVLFNVRYSLPSVYMVKWNVLIVNIKYIIRGVFLGATNLIIGQSLRFSERTVLLYFPEGALSAYYLAFRIYASIQQIISLNIINLNISDINRDFYTTSKKLKKIYTYIGMVVFLSSLAFYKLNAYEVIQRVIVPNVNLSETLLIFIILTMSIIPQMMMPANLIAIYNFGRYFTWLKFYFSINLITILCMVAVKFFILNIYVFSFVIVISVYVTYFTSNKIINNDS